MFAGSQWCEKEKEWWESSQPVRVWKRSLARRMSRREAMVVSLLSVRPGVPTRRLVERYTTCRAEIFHPPREAGRPSYGLRFN